MIREESFRVASGHICPPIVRELTAIGALIRLMLYEVGYGGEVTRVTKSRIDVRTQVLNCVDHVTFDGSEEEMRPLLLAIYYFLYLIDRREMAETSFQQLQQMCGGSGQISLLLASLDPIFTTMKPAKISMLIALEIWDEAELQAVMKLPNEDLQPVLELRQENPAASIQEILSLVHQ